MERTTNVNVNQPPEKIWWRKTGGGSLRLLIDGRRVMIKPNQKFKASIEEVPRAFLDVIVPLSALPKDEPAPVMQAPETVYVLKARGKSGWYDVVDKNGKVLNEKALKKEVAEKLIQDLAR